MATARAARLASRMPAIWLRRTIALLLTPVGLLLIAVTRLLIVSDYNTTTATAIASSGGYVNTLLGTVIPLVPVVLPYLAIALLIFRRFLLSALAFGAALLISPTRLAPPTALSRAEVDWHRIEILVRGHLILSVIILCLLLIIDLSAFTRTFRRRSVVAVTLALLATAYLLPYVLYVYPFPQKHGYYEDFLRQPWLSAERITVKSGYSTVGYALTEDDHWMIILKATPRVIQYIPIEDVISRSVCDVNSQAAELPESPLVPLLNPRLARLPSCWRSGSNTLGSPFNKQGREWTARKVSTSSTSFGAVPGLGTISICASGEVTATVSIELYDAPAGFRVRIDRHQIMEPGAVRFVPAGPHDSFSFTFTQDLQPVDGIDRHVLQLQWRSPYSVPAILERGTIELRYQSGSPTC
jgi:hypothetical protein